MLKRVEIDPYIKVKKEEDLVEPPAIIRVVKFDEDATKAFSESMSKAQSLPQPVIPSSLTVTGARRWRSSR